MKKLVILLHGVGSNGADMLSLSGLWRDALPGVSFEAPNAPNRSEFTIGFQWFSVNGVTTENRPARVEAARAAFDATITTLLQKHGLQDQLEKVVFVGFSQGTIMALDAIASGRWKVAGVVGFSGRLASPEPLSPTKVPVLLLHGAEDNVIPAWESEAAAKTLRSFGLDVGVQTFPHLPHSISLEGATAAATFIAQHLKVQA